MRLGGMAVIALFLIGVGWGEGHGRYIQLTSKVGELVTVLVVLLVLAILLLVVVLIVLIMPFVTVLVLSVLLVVLIVRRVSVRLVIIVCAPLGGGLMVRLGHLRLLFMTHVSTSQGKGIAGADDRTGVDVIRDGDASTHERVAMAVAAGTKAATHPASEDRNCTNCDECTNDDSDNSTRGHGLGCDISAIASVAIDRLGRH